MEPSKTLKGQKITKLSPADQPGNEKVPGTQGASFERERKILLDIGNDLTKVREKNDLITLFSSGIKGLFHFTHTIVTLVEPERGTYTPFLLNSEVSPIRDHPTYPSLIVDHFPLDEPFIKAVMASEGPISFLMEDIMDVPGSPVFLKINYERGIREILMTPLRSKGQVIGFLHLYSDDTVSFTGEFKRIIEGVAPQISAAVSNIIKNEEIKRSDLVNQVLLTLSNDIVSVRNRKDLLQVINVGLKQLIDFSHSMMTVLDKSGETYMAFLTDPESKPKAFAKYIEAISKPYPVEDGIYDEAMRAGKPVVLSLKQIDMDSAPLWLKLNYTAGAREMLIKALPGEDAQRHSLILFSDKLNGFDDTSVSIVERVSSQLSTAASNILANEEIINKESEKSFLLDFSHAIAAVRSKDDLVVAVRQALSKVSAIKGYAVRAINNDMSTTSTYIHDGGSALENDPDLIAIKASKFPIEDGMQNRVLDSPIPLFFNVNSEIAKGRKIKYLDFWKKMGFQQMVGITLQTGSKKIGIFWLAIEDINIALLQGIAAQISIAMANIFANDEILLKSTEQSFLLGFSSDIASVRTKSELEVAIHSVLKNMLNTRLAMIRLIDEDGIHLSPFMYDKSIFANVIKEFEELADNRITLEEEFTARVLSSQDPVVFNVEKELAERPDQPYVLHWKKVGYKNTYGAPLRVGNKDLGTLWLLGDDISQRLLKGICAQVSIAIDNILSHKELLGYKQMLEVENDQLKEQIKTIYNFSEIIGQGEAMQKVYHLMSLVAESNSTVLLLGETGTGKELIARAIHNASPRKDKLMIKINCAALPANLIESELFGHEKGAFTGATERRAGKFELAHNSTLFLDEIGEMPLELQVKLLRAIQEREIEIVGGATTIKVDVRIIAATNRDLAEEVKAGNFRSDLYYRLNVFPISLPPLRDRLDDIEPLTNYFVARFSKNTGKKIRSVAPRVMQALRSYSWPGNVRELEHLIERSILLASEEVLKEVHIPQTSPDAKIELGAYSDKTLEEVERDYIIGVMKRCSGKISGSGGAAEILAMPATTLHSKFKKLGINKRDYL
ncbi:sigma 54-interacting transcriptional regulator [Imperialibacter roseus]|uniref:Sigma 54-interacting transcriptional regulator n=1 Tax=Imperialibacter roseus TaxID=1324217 RepID=A0ABZ0IUR2_9BACT|nr:sigma 54-interacting transcriptional regulator [Imperialibacter roseus]WOK08336.1 sigma 54-interacting transcriptional regulator [Imperialibacter roseus]